MYAVRKAFPDHAVPVPELSGWRKHDDMPLIYMSVVRGQTLRQAWPSLNQSEKQSTCSDLRNIVRLLREIVSAFPPALVGMCIFRCSHHQANRHVGSVGGGTVQDIFFRYDYEQGSFPSVSSFNDWVFAVATRQPPESEIELGLYREYLPDSANVCFTHGDPTLGNMMISGPQGEIVGIIDWEQAGWYPDYWEYCKLLYGVEYAHEWWDAGWVDPVMEPFETACFAFAEYVSWRCA